ncbi:MAG TPA: 50S ribosomal protein L15e [Candidatus Nitrosocosmicus sp.]|nr:50S ribosomal protein L15e [Candidatus Nitrosocosmicus sp.]HSA75141.1 50S ribosomal protein L15e [Candidatus Nitrosocosmicus sp.]
MYSHIAETWKSMLKTRSQELKSKAYQWRREPTINRIEHPSRLDRARALGYKAKQGIVVVRIRVGRGGMRKQRPVSGRRPKHIGVVHIKQKISMKRVAEKRVNEKYVNLKVMGSYLVYQDGMYSWFEVILVDPSHPSIIKDKEMRSRINFN